MLKFLGITSEAPADGSIPAWQGVSKKHRGIAFAISLALGLATFLVTRWLLSDLPPEGYLPLVPWNAAAAILLISTLVAERGLIRNAPSETCEI
ncbi:hypothetical protein [Glutamicibacter sp. NPDC127525]|uniref:hypothetical protein n=1 Tax=unclassified Glutamicibacter TaxID=2627139 RepID=UPI00362ABA86